MNHPEHDKLIAIAKGWQMERSVEDEWVPVRHGDAALDWARAAGWHRIRIAPGQPEVAEPENRVVECAKRLIEYADFQLGGVLNSDSKAKEIPSNATSRVKARHLAALRDALTPPQRRARRAGMTEREMLELAAKAAGFSWWRSKHGHIKLILPGGESLDCCTGWPTYDSRTGENLPTPEFADALIEHGWTPLTDDGDALRLAVQCGIEISTVDDEPDSDGRYSRACAGYSTESDPRIRYVFEDHKGDIFCATRLAITRAAAEIGKAAGMKGGE